MALRLLQSAHVFGLGMMEIGLIIALAVMLFPPKELPKVARAIARVYGQVRKTADDFRSAVLQDEDLRAPIDEIKSVYEEARGEVRDAERKARQQLAKAQMELRMATARRVQAEREAKAVETAKSGETPETDANSHPDGAVVAAFPGTADEGDSTEPVVASDPRALSRPRPVAANDQRETDTPSREMQSG